jgi:hypothetical protein
VKVNRNSWPGTNVPESKVTPSSEVAVCETAPVFVQQTIVPVGISTVSGWNEKSAIAMIVSDSSHDPETRCGADPAETPACGSNSAQKPSVTSAATSEVRRK